MPTKMLVYLHRYRKGEDKAFVEFVRAKRELIRLHGKKTGVRQKQITEEMLHLFNTTRSPQTAFDIGQIAKNVAKRKGKPRRKWKRWEKNAAKNR